jgi:predicted ABC-class ATPase
MFQNSFLPDVTPNDMRGVMSLLALIANPESKAAIEFLAKLSAEKDQAVAALNQSAANVGEAARLAATVSDLEAREIALAGRETALAEAQAAHNLRVGEFRAHAQAMAAAVTGVKLPA